jgi:GH25 family lysozyme M1 (1,4-beta-N-acetylmuramidase)
MLKIARGIDLSHHQKVDWSKVTNSTIDFAIIRMGYGSYLPSQKDREFENNVKGVIKNNIPFAVYLYSYAKTLYGGTQEEATVDSEIDHARTRLKEISEISKEAKPFAVYYSLAEDGTKGAVLNIGDKRILTKIAMKFCEAMIKDGYCPGIYMSENAFKTKVDVQELYNCGYSLWVGKFLSGASENLRDKSTNIDEQAPDIGVKYDIWNYTENGKIDGITGSGVLFDYMYKYFGKDRM